MGTWDVGPFSNDAAADFLAEASDGAASRAVSRALGRVAKCPSSKYLEVDEAHAAVAAAELVAISFGRGSATEVSGVAGEVGQRLKPSDASRRLAILALDRVLGANSELVELWADAGGCDALRCSLEEIGTRLAASAEGPVPVFRPAVGQVFVAEWEGRPFVGQVLSANEVVIIEGTPASDAAALRLVATERGHRVPCAAARELRGARFLGKSPIRKAFKGPKLYATEVGYVVGYALTDAAMRGRDFVDLETAMLHEAHEFRTVASLATLSAGDVEPLRVRLPDDREAQERQQRRAGWVERRRVSGPGAFDDLALTRDTFSRIRDTSSAGAIQWMESITKHGSGGAWMNEENERRRYIHAGLVALWRGTWSVEHVPVELRDLVPAPPESLGDGVRAASAIAADVLRRASELRMMWEEAEDHGEGIRRAVEELRNALA